MSRDLKLDSLPPPVVGRWIREKTYYGREPLADDLTDGSDFSRMADKLDNYLSRKGFFVADVQNGFFILEKERK